MVNNFNNLISKILELSNLHKMHFLLIKQHFSNRIHLLMMRLLDRLINKFYVFFRSTIWINKEKHIDDNNSNFSIIPYQRSQKLGKLHGDTWGVYEIFTIWSWSTYITEVWKIRNFSASSHFQDLIP